MYEARSAESIRIYMYESIVCLIEFFLWLKIQEIVHLKIWYKLNLENNLQLAW